jgi:GT2 family glycosyltransferase
VRSDLVKLTRRARSRIGVAPVAGAAGGGVDAGTNSGPRRSVDAAGRELLRTTVLFHQGWVEAQLQQTFENRDEAIDAYLSTAGCSPHPLFLPDYVRATVGGGRPGRDLLVWYLRAAEVNGIAATHPLLDVAALIECTPGAAEHPRGPVVAWLEQAAPHDPVPVAEGYRKISLDALIGSSLSAAAAWHDDNALRVAPRATPDRPVGLLDPRQVPSPTASSSSDPLVSVVMPMWNRGSVVRAAIESVQAQSLDDWELLVVDDGSTDDGLQVVRGIAHFDPRVVVVPLEHAGVCRARNEGLARARGEYVAFLDTDNAWDPDFLHVMVSTMQTREWDMAHSALRAEGSEGTYYRAHEGTLDELRVANYIDLNVLVVRTSVVRGVGGFDESLRRGVDWDLVLRLAEDVPLRLVPYIGVDYEDREAPGPRISDTEPSSWLSVVASRHLARQHARTAPRLQHTSLVVRAPNALAGAKAWVDLVTRVRNLEIVLVGVRLGLLKHVALQLLTDAVGGRFVRLQVDRGAETTANVGLAASAGRHAVVVLRHTALRPETVEALGAALADPAVVAAAPVLLGPDNLVESAGATFAGVPLPIPYLRGHSAADLPVDDLAMPAALGPVLAGRTDELLDVGGFDPLYEDVLCETDLSVRLVRRLGGHVRILTSQVLAEPPEVRARRRAGQGPARADAATRLFRLERASHLLAAHGIPGPGREAETRAAWLDAGFEVIGFDYPLLRRHEPAPLDVPVRTALPRLRPSRAVVAEGPPRLRWSIDLAAHGGTNGSRWGDAFFGSQLAGALRDLGQHVSVDFRENRHRATRDFDDVVLVLRGLDLVGVRPGRVNVLWVISHPDEVTAQEAAPYDLVFAASPTWSARRSQQWGRPVHTLLQATDPQVFRADPDGFEQGPEVLFVGNTRRVFRDSVRHARAAGLDVTVHGSGWERFLDPGAVASTFVPNDELGALYGSAGVVLNDHWDDMRDGGFVSNRIMDAASAGARIASDQVVGVDLESTFHGLVRTYASPAELHDLVRRRDVHYPDARERVAAAARVAEEHSFARRAATLLDAAAPLWAARQP